ncbi:hypothetical protein JCM11491_004433 [Sporobolomyces phaffii]
MSHDRATLLSSAVSFLRDPSTSSSPLAQRIAFLESKGLNQQEIEQALAAAHAHGGPLVPNQQLPYGARAREFERDWRDWFIMSVLGGGVGWLAVKLAQKFLLPSLQPPSESDLEASQKALEAKYDEAADLLRTLQASTDAVAQSLDEQKVAVERELDHVARAVDDLHRADQKRDEWAQGVQRQVDDMAKTLPTLLDKHSATQAAALSDLQTELKSLKSLVIARRPPPATSSPSTSPAVPASSSSSASTSTSSPFGVPRTPSLPAWQMKGSSAASLASASTSNSNSTVQPEDPSASGVLVEKPPPGGDTSSSSTAEPTKDSPNPPQ